jgi:hypothetical protein
MRKIITALYATCGLVAGFQAQATNYPVTPQQRATAEQVAEAGVPLSELAANAPDSHTVKRGDTLWAISGIFLKRPWRWPELWGMNKEQIRNPHLIFPGQVLYLDKSGGRARLRVGQPPQVDASGRLAPGVRTESLDQAIASIPYNVIEPFLSQPLVVDENGLANSPRIVAAQEGRVFLGVGDTAYVRGPVEENVSTYQVYRPGRKLIDPDDGKTVLGHEAFYLGTIRMEKAGDPSTFKVVSSKQEMGSGDRLVPAAANAFVNYVPQAPQGEVKARVMTIYGGVDSGQAGRNQIISVNKGRNDGMAVGHVLALHRTGAVVEDKTTEKKGALIKKYETVTLPDERYGLVFVFRVFDRVSYALIMESAKPVQIGDKLTQP